MSRKRALPGEYLYGGYKPGEGIRQQRLSISHTQKIEYNLDGEGAEVTLSVKIGRK
jgi:hypothetical protein